MSDDSVRAALRSNASLVVVEAPAGCGKTHQGADYARDISVATRPGRLLILTHTHAACSVFSDYTKGTSSYAEIRTIDSIIAQIASAYHSGLGLPAEIAAWVRGREERHAELAVKVAALMKRYPMIAALVAQRHPVVICDEYQDSSGDQHAVVMALLAHGVVEGFVFAGSAALAVEAASAVAEGFALACSGISAVVGHPAHTYPAERKKLQRA